MILRGAALGFASLVAACAQPIELDWKHDIGAGSVSTPLVTQSYIAFGHERGVAVLEPTGQARCTFETRGEVVGRPIADEGRIYFGSTDYALYAIDERCQLLWKLATHDRIKSDPVLAGERVIVTSYDGHVYAADRKGARLWTYPAAGAEPVGDFSYSSPALHDGVLYVGNLDGNLYAIEVDSGALRFRFPTGGAVTSSPLVTQGLVYFGSNDGHVYALELDGTKVRWRFATGDWVNSSPVVAAGTLYVGSNDRHLYALDPESGALRFRFSAQGPLIAIPRPYKNLVFAAGGSGDGAIYALDGADGTLFWSYTTGGKIESDPVIVGDRLYVTSADQTLYCFKLNSTRRPS